MIIRITSILVSAVLLAATPVPSRAGDGTDLRAAIAASQKVAPGGIDELKTVRIGGIDQWISVRGNSAANPILLFIHGGPGFPMMPLAWTFQRPWEEFFTVVQWDQRGAGKTFAAAGQKPDEALTIDRMQADAEEMIALLRKTYHQDKIFVMAHSWGSITGLRMAQHHPEWLHAYIGVGQVVNAMRNEEVGYRETLARVEAAGDADAIRELKALAPYPGPSNTITLATVMAERKWVVASGGMLFGKTEDDTGALMALSPLYNEGDLASVGPGAMASAQVLIPQSTGVDFDSVTSFQCPVFFFAGADDRTTPTSMVKEYFARIHAPAKNLFVIEHAAHFVVTEAPGEVLVDLVRDVRPLAPATASR